ncbi:hypothetical protein F511_16480 [Dorcoceras hygrometricum]|uniref:Uncharacterized protein n=1 Tax=Dorcoceras hygrometricum TaxID=472368 RepID=A0A2Z7D1M7_9LAMI|nr:hypothetical protein F511_16480 [Dorcoceras hygrometricum]
MVKRLATSPHDPLGITDSACKNQSVMVSVQYDPFNKHIPIKSTTIGKSVRVDAQLANLWRLWPPPPHSQATAAAAPAAADLRRKFVSGQFDEENPFVLISSALLVQPEEGVSVLVVDRIGDYLPQSTEKSRVLVIPVGARHKCQQAHDGTRRRAIVAVEGCAMMRERARMAAPGRQSSSAAVPHKRRMACCPSRKDVAPLEACWSTGCERRRAAAAVHHALSLGGASRESSRIAAGPPCAMNAAVDGRPLQATGVGARWRRWSTLRARCCAALRFERWCTRCHRVFVAAAAAADLRRKFVSGQFDEENPFVLISSALLVQPDEGVSVRVVNRIGDYLPQYTEKRRVLVIPVGARHKCQQDASLKLGRPYHHFDGPID